jgi:beta-glucanase (GH16 family)
MRVSSSLHGPSTTPVDVPVSQDVALPTGADADFHDYAVEWDPDDIVFLVDGKPTFQITPARRPLKYAPWVWNHPFHMILNLAVGGLFPGPPDDTTPFPATIQADWVRVSVRAGDGGATNDAADRETVDAGADAVASDQNDLDVATGD